MFHNFRDIGGREHRRAAGADRLNAGLLCPPLECARPYLRQGGGFVKRVDEQPLSHSAPDCGGSSSAPTADPIFACRMACASTAGSSSCLRGAAACDDHRGGRSTAALAVPIGDKSSGYRPIRAPDTEMAGDGASARCLGGSDLPRHLTKICFHCFRQRLRPALKR